MTYSQKEVLLHDHLVSALKGKFNLDNGICGTLWDGNFIQGLPLLKKYFKSWPEWSGCEVYPILIDGDTYQCRSYWAMAQFDIVAGSTRYGHTFTKIEEYKAARIRLLKHIIDCLAKDIKLMGDL